MIADSGQDKINEGAMLSPCSKIACRINSTPVVAVLQNLALYNSPMGY